MQCCSKVCIAAQCVNLVQCVVELVGARAGADNAHVRLWFRYAQARRSSVSANQSSSSSSSMYDETGAHVYNRARHNSNPVGMAHEGAAGGRQPTPVHQGKARANTTANTTATVKAKGPHVFGGKPYNITSAPAIRESHAVTLKEAANMDSAKKARIEQQGTVHGYVNTTPYENTSPTSLGGMSGSGDAPPTPSMASHGAAPAQTYTAKKTKHRMKKKGGPKRTGTVMIYNDEPRPTLKQPAPASTEPAGPYSMENSEYEPADPYSMASSEYELMTPESGTATEHGSDPAVHTYSCVTVPNTGSSNSAAGSTDPASGYPNAVLNVALYESTSQQQSAVQPQTLYSATPTQQGKHAPDLAGLCQCVECVRACSWCACV